MAPTGRATAPARRVSSRSARCPGSWRPTSRSCPTSSSATASRAAASSRTTRASCASRRPAAGRSSTTRSTSTPRRPASARWSRQCSRAASRPACGGTPRMAVGELSAPRAAVDPAEIDRLSRDVIAGSALFGAANVVMQLSLLPVGRGVAESTVDSGRVDKHPFKRQRTTGSYLIVAMLGTEAEREAMQGEVNRQHSGVVREEGESDVPYNAFDPKLQLWVAACIYVGVSGWLALGQGPQTEAQRAAFYRRCARLGTTLQVPEEMWPADREAFAEYWWPAVREIEMDDVSRGYLRDLANVRFLYPWVRRLTARPNRLLTVGFLPQEFRDELAEPWSERDQRRFERFLRTALWLDRRLPAAIRHSLLNVYEWGVKRRIRRGRPIV